MVNFFQKIQQFPQNLKEEKEKLASIKEELITYLLRSDLDLPPQVWTRFNDVAAAGKLLDDKEISNAIKEGYIRSLKQCVGELPVIETSPSEENNQNISFSRTRKILDIFEVIDFQKWNKNKEKNSNKGYTGGEESFINSIKDNPDFLRLTKEALIKSLNQADIRSSTSPSSFRIIRVGDFIPALVPEEIKNSLEVQKAAQGVITESFRNNDLYLADSFQEYFQISEEMIQSPDLQQAVQDAIKMKEEKLRKIEEEAKKDPMLLKIIDRDEISQLKKLIEKIKKWTAKKLENNL